MSILHISLFGRFCIRRGEKPLEGLDSFKVQELLCYLLLYRNQPHSREILANLLWEDGSPAQARSYLRKTLWQLQSVLHDHASDNTPPLLLADPQWIQLNSDENLWLDVAAFEQAFDNVQDVLGQEMTKPLATELQQAVDLYQRDLLDGWYQDWCLFERERFQHMYIIMLDKLMLHCETHGKYEAGVDYGFRILRCDLARERTHRCLMRLYYMAGNRTEALRQYKHCATALRQELDVEPGRRTRALYQLIRADVPFVDAPHDQKTIVLSDTLHNQLTQLQAVLDSISIQLQQEIKAIEKLT